MFITIPIRILYIYYQHYYATYSCSHHKDWCILGEHAPALKNVVSSQLFDCYGTKQDETFLSPKFW